MNTSVAGNRSTTHHHVGAVTRSGPSDGLVTVTSAWNTGSPMAIAGDHRDGRQQRPAGGDDHEHAARREADGLEDREVAAALAGDEQQRREQVHQADGEQQASEPSRIGRMPRARGHSSSVCRRPPCGDRRRRPRAARARGRGAGAGSRCSRPSPPGAAGRAAGKISTRPSLSGSTWRPTSERHGAPALRTAGGRRRAGGAPREAAARRSPRPAGEHAPVRDGVGAVSVVVADGTRQWSGARRDAWKPAM